MHNAQDTQSLQLILTVVVDLPGIPATTTHDLHVEIQPDARAADFLAALSGYMDCTFESEVGLVRMLSAFEDDIGKCAQGYFPTDAPLLSCGLIDGMTLYVRHRIKWPAPDLPVDTALAPDDLFLVDERGSHRGRVTRLPVGEPVDVGSNPPIDRRFLVVDERQLPRHSFTLTNLDGTSVTCDVVDGAGLHLFGTPVHRAGRIMLPGSSITFKRTETGGLRNGEPPRQTDYASFAIATVEGAYGRSPHGKVQFDPTARYDAPTYGAMQERLATLPPSPDEPEKKRFPIEQVLVPLGMAVALFLFTKSLFSVIAIPATVIIPFVMYSRQRREAQNSFEKDTHEWRVRLAEAAKELSELVGVEEGKLRSECPPSSTKQQKSTWRCSRSYAQTATG